MAALLAVFVLMRGASARGQAAPAGPAQASQGDGPPIDLTCVGLQVPATVHVKALVAETPDHAPGGSPLDWRYEWDFGDPAGRWNLLPGWNAAHVYDKPGQYTVTLTVRQAETGKTLRRTTWVRVGQDDRRRIYVSTQGSDAADGSTPAKAVRSAGRALQLGPRDAVILFRRGDIFDIGQTIYTSAERVRLTAYADADATGQPDALTANPLPILRKIDAPKGKESMFYFKTNSRDVFIDSLEFDSKWDLNSEYGIKKIPATAFTIGGTNFTVRGCSFRNLTDCLNTELKPTGVLLQDSHFSEEIRAYCYYGNGTDHVILGNVMTHSRQEHLIRCTHPGVTRLLIAYNDLSRLNNRKGSIELRTAYWFYVADNHIDGGTMRVGPQDQDQHYFPKDWQQIHCTWGVVQDNRFDGVFVNIRLGTEHCAFRNNIVRRTGPDADWGFFVACDKPGYDQVRKVIDVRIEHNTVIEATEKGQFIYVQGKPMGLTIRNNLYVAPRLNTPETLNAAAVVLTRNDMEGIDRIENNTWPAGRGGVQQMAKTKLPPAAWATQAAVKGDRYESVPLDANDNPPRTATAGARLGHDKADRDAQRRRDPRPSPGSEAGKMRDDAAPAPADGSDDEGPRM